ncbi:ATPase domain-containing protein [Thermoproteota archaeon]
MTKILIADDEPNILLLSKVLFEDLGMTVITAKDGSEAIEKAISEKPDMAILDVIMPKKTGFEVCRSIRNTSAISNMPIIILSALGDEYNKITGFEEGADDYITKPFNLEELKLRAKTLLFRHQSRQSTIKHVSVQPSPTDTDISIETVPTGIPELDKCLYGGLPKGANILLVGPVGEGKSTFSRQFIAQGLEKGDRCLFIALDDNPKKIRDQLSANLNKNISDFDKIDLIRFIDAYSSESLSNDGHEKFSITGPLELNHLSALISDASAEIGQTVQNKLGGRRVIDSISSLFIHFELSSVQRFINQIARTSIAFGGVTTLFILEKGTIDDISLNNIKYIMDGIIEFAKIEGKISARVASMKWTPYSNQWVSL